MSNNIITTDLQSQSVDSPFIELYELDLENGTILYFHPGVDELLNTVKFHRVGFPAENTNPTLVNEYLAMPIMLEGIEINGEGSSNRPTLTIANVSSLLRSLLDDESFSFEDLIGTRITKRRTFEKYLHGGTDEATPFELPVQTYLIDRVGGENSVSVTFELAAPFDVSGVKLPARAVVGKYCTWVYQGYNLGKGGCVWRADSTIYYGSVAYQAFFDIKDRPLVDNSLFTAAVVPYTGSHLKDDFVEYNSLKWRSEIDSNTSVPGVDQFWKEVFTWSTWSNAVTYSVNQYVKYNNHIWRSRLANNLNKEPKDNSLYWTRVDYCSKELSGCKARFQFSPVSGGLPSTTKETNKTLPFGAYPGSAKFK